MKLSWFLLLTVLLSACATTVPEPFARSESEPSLVWPAAPEPARIEYVKQFTGAEDLGMNKSFWHRIVEFFAGPEDRRMVRPYAIAVNNERLVVADPDASAVHVFNLKRKKYKKISRVGKLSLNSPIGIAMGENRLYIADSVLNRVFVLDENLEILTTLQQFQRPTGLAFDSMRQHLFVTDTLAHHVKVFDRDGHFQFLIGGHGEKDAQFNFPSHLSFGDDLLFVNDTMNFRIQSFKHDGSHLNTFGRQGDVSGAFAQSKGVAVDSDGHVYVADALAGRIQIFDQNGLLLLGFGTFGREPGNFQLPAGISIWKDKIFVADSYNGRVQMFRYLGEDN